MLKGLTSLVIFAALSVSVSADVHMHADMQARMMDCCKNKF